MSRSRRKTPIHPMTGASSDHPWKKSASRKVRRTVKQRLSSTHDDTSFSGKRWALVDPWSAEKDGKFWFGRTRADLLRK